MKKLTIAATAFLALIGITEVAASATQFPGDYFTSATGVHKLLGVKGIDWDCDGGYWQQTCCYKENSDGSRTKIVGMYYNL